MTFTIETRTLPHIFARAAAQATQTISPDPSAGTPVRETLSVEADNPSLLLQHWINAVIHAFYEKLMIFSAFEVRQFGPKGGGWYLQVEATGKRLAAASAFSLLKASCTAAEIFGDNQSCRAEFTLMGNEEGTNLEIQDAGKVRSKLT